MFIITHNKVKMILGSCLKYKETFHIHIKGYICKHNTRILPQKIVFTNIARKLRTFSISVSFVNDFDASVYL